MERKYMVIAVTVLAVVSGVMCIYTCLNHEPGTETVDILIDEETGSAVSTAKTYLFTFDGKDAVSVNWDFGDGTSYDGAVQIIKEYPQPGIYTVTCTAVSEDGLESVSQYTVDIRPQDFGPFDGYDNQIALAVVTAALSLTAVMLRRF